MIEVSENSMVKFESMLSVGGITVTLLDELNHPRYRIEPHYRGSGFIVYRFVERFNDPRTAQTIPATWVSVNDEAHELKAAFKLVRDLEHESSHTSDKVLMWCSLMITTEEQAVPRAL